MSVLLHGIGAAFLEDMRRFGNQISPAVGEAASRNVRGAVDAAFPGPAALRMSALTMVVANALGDMLSEIEPASPILTPATDGRVLAVEAAFREVLHNAVRDRAVVNHRNRVIANGGLQ